jgi:phosphoglycolate phosphatase-like HAD superfamily hydrolase
MTGLITAPSDWLVLLNPDLPQRLGQIRHVLLDFDGTISLLREGWEGIMVPLMLEVICPDGPPPPEIEQEVRHYVDQSTGMLTIRQMEWLSQAVARHGLADQVLSSADYKAIYVQRILTKVRGRIADLEAGKKTRQDFMVAGAQAWMEALAERNLHLYLASGTDHGDVLNEARALGIVHYFGGKIYGALDESEAHDKELIIRRILEQNGLHGDELLVIGDGPVEVRLAAAQGAIALGLASDEIARQGWNLNKLKRLKSAGADLMIPDFTQAECLLNFLFPEA